MTIKTTNPKQDAFKPKTIAEIDRAMMKRAIKQAAKRNPKKKVKR